MSDNVCYSCLALSGERRISPGPTIFEGSYWVLEHAYPTTLPGWLVLVLKRHVRALHELSREEFVELGELLPRTVYALRAHFNCEKEYVACFAEAEHFNHVHVHVVPKPHDPPPELRGSAIFRMLKDNGIDPELAESIRSLCERLRNIFMSNS